MATRLTHHLTKVVDEATRQEDVKRRQMELWLAAVTVTASVDCGSMGAVECEVEKGSSGKVGEFYLPISEDREMLGKERG